MLGGLLILVLGVLLFLDSLGVIDGIGDYFGPLAIVAIGIHLIFDRPSKKCGCGDAD